MDWKTVFRFVLAALATWRLSFLLVRESGPFALIERSRNAFQNTALEPLFRCVKCMSLWVSVPFAYFVGGSWGELCVIWLAISGVTTLIDETTRPPFEWQETTSHELLQSPDDPTAE